MAVRAEWRHSGQNRKAKNVSDAGAVPAGSTNSALARKGKCRDETLLVSVTAETGSSPVQCAVDGADPVSTARRVPGRTARKATDVIRANYDNRQRRIVRARCLMQ